MTRINLIPPTTLADQHLIAEIKEINQLCGSYKKSLKSKRGISNIPATYRLGKGHVTFFYNKGLYLHKRFEKLKEEAIKRGFNINATFNNVFKKSHYNDWIPRECDIPIIVNRISTRLKQRDNWYKYNKEIINLNPLYEINIQNERACN